VKLAAVIPWDKLANVYYRKMNSDFGAPSLDARMVIGAVIIKHMLNIDDREVVAQIQENMYLQYFVGLSSFTTEEPFDASLMVSIRYRLGQDVMEAFNNLILQEAGVIPPLPEQPVINTESSGENDRSDVSSEKPTEDLNDRIEDLQASDNDEIKKGKAEKTPGVPNSGTLLVDATIAEQQIEYPTDLKMLNESREQLERIIEQVCKEGSLLQPRMYKNNARKDYLGLAKKKKKTKKDIRKGLRAQLQYVSRDLKYINKLLDEHTALRTALDKRDWKLLQVIHEVYRQQQEMYTEDKRSIEDRIVSVHQPPVRPMPRGKDRVQTEFGSKQLVMLKDGYTHVAKISWDNFNEGVHLQDCVEKYKQIYGCYPEKVSVDSIFGNQANRKYLKEKEIRFVGKQLGRPPKTTSAEKRKLRKEMAGRNAVEAKFGQGKSSYGLHKIKARIKETSESWILSIYFIMNLVKLSERVFLCLLEIILGKHPLPVILINRGSQRNNDLIPLFGFFPAKNKF
jgi:IS5 family transposase